MRIRRPVGRVANPFLPVVAIRALVVAPILASALIVPSYADPIFSPPFLSFSLAGSPRGAAAADLNGDGRPDLAVAGSSSNTVIVLLGNGDGTFAARTDFRVGNCPLAVAIGDLNVDGRPDLVVASACSRTVSVLLGNGDGTFAARTEFGTGANPYSVAIADFNLDGRPDVAVANYLSDDVSVLLGNGDGTLAPKTDFLVESGPLSVAIADFNRDGWQDLVTANFNSSRVSVLLGKGDGSFAPASAFGAGVTPRSVAIADVNVDGIPDLAAAVYYQYTLSVLLGNGDGTFGANMQFGVGNQPEWVAMADFNGDAWPDAAVADGLSGTVSVLLGNGDGTFGTATGFEIGSTPYSVAIADFDRNGGLDLAVTSGGKVSVLLNRSPGFPTAVTVSLVTLDAASDVVRLRWNVSDRDRVYRVERRTRETAWTVLGTGEAGSNHIVAYEDRDVTHETSYGYRLGYSDGLQERYSAEAWTTVPSAPGLDLVGFAPNPAPRENISIVLTLPTQRQGTLELFDVGGRRLAVHELSNMGPGRHLVRIAGLDPRFAGVVWIRLSHGGSVLSKRGIIFR